ncbi:MAG: DUF523 domain-containing protein [Myxococcota bacterium]
MLLAHHGAGLDAIRRPTAAEPWRVLVSGCIAGWRCGVDGTDYGLGASLDDLFALPTVRPLPFCPEQHALGTPRTTPDIHGGDGADVLAGRARILDEHGTDLTAAMVAGARAMLAFAEASRAELAILRAHADPGYAAPAGALDHHQHPWTREHLPGPHPRA